eukprot:606892-Pyramimonas_sp.AAC.1
MSRPRGRSQPVQVRGRFVPLRSQTSWGLCRILRGQVKTLRRYSRPPPPGMLVRAESEKAGAGRLDRGGGGHAV